MTDDERNEKFNDLISDLRHRVRSAAEAIAAKLIPLIGDETYSAVFDALSDELLCWNDDGRTFVTDVKLDIEKTGREG